MSAPPQKSPPKTPPKARSAGLSNPLSPVSEIVVVPRSAADAFWSFSTSVYASEGVAAACLGLQDRRGLDVNLVLFCLWAALSGGLPMDTARTLAALRVSSRWQDEVVASLRQARQVMKGGVDGIPESLSEPLRERVKALELDAEQLEQKALAGVLNELEGGLGPLRGQPLEARAARAAANLATLFGTLKIPPDSEDRKALITLLRAAAPRLSPRVAKLLVG